MKKKKTPLTSETFEKISTRIFELLKKEALLVPELLISLKDFGNEKTWQVIEFLQSENKITTDETGKVSLKQS